jgi:hypothetical protein
MLGKDDRAQKMRMEIKRPTIDGGFIHPHQHEGLDQRNKPYFAFWSYKVYCSDKFDLLGNSIAIIAGITTTARAEAIINWVEAECEHMRQTGNLAVNLPPNFFPFTQPGDADWHPRYENFNMPGNYHNGGLWPFICGFYVAALVAAKRYDLAERKLVELTKLVKLTQNPDLPFGFNEWIKAQDGTVKGVDWQTWSAALYLHAPKCVEDKCTPFFDEMRA